MRRLGVAIGWIFFIFPAFPMDVWMGRLWEECCTEKEPTFTYKDSFEFQMLIEQAETEDVGALLMLGYMHDVGEKVEMNKRIAMDLYKRARDQGSINACYNIGILYEEGAYAIRKNIKKALQYYKFASDYGDSESSNHLGVLYHRGEKIEQDIKQALFFYSRAVEQGNSEAPYNLSSLYFTGLFIKRNVNLALKYLALAANRNDASAYCILGYLYLNGIGVHKDKDVALSCYEKAESLGDNDARQIIQGIQNRELATLKQTIFDHFKKAAERAPQTNAERTFFFMDNISSTSKD